MVKVFAHRGYKKKFPENTMLAFQKAIEYGADGIELDVHLSKDHHLVVIHDETLDRTTHRSGVVSQLTLAEIRQAKIRAGFMKYERVPLLKEVLELIKDTAVELNIEIKGRTDGILEAQLMALLSQFDLNDRVIISSFELTSIQKVKQLSPAIETAYLYSKYKDQPWLLTADYLFDGIHTNTYYISKDFTSKIAAEGLNVRMYTVNRENDIKYWLDSGIDAIITDDVELALKTKKFI